MFVLYNCGAHDNNLAIPGLSVTHHINAKETYTVYYLAYRAEDVTNY